MSKKVNTTFPKLRFPEFKGSWGISNIENSCEVKNNLRKPISLPERALMQGLYPYYGPTGIIDYLDEYGLDGKFALIGEDGDHFLKYKSWSQTQLVEGKFNANNHVHIICGTKECLVEWFFVYFQHRNIIDSLTRQGAGRYKLNKASLFRLSIALPTITEQEKIASFLGAVDTRLTQLRRKHELLQTYKRGVMQKLFSQQIRFKGDDGKTFPDWEKKELGSFIEEYSNKSIIQDEYEVLTSSRNGLLPQRQYYDNERITERDNIGFNIIPPNFVTYRSRSDNRLFFFNENELEFTGIISTYYPVFRFKNGVNKFFTEFLHYNQKYIGKYSVGTSQTVLSLNELRKIYFKIPCLKEQENIADFLTAIDKKIEAVAKQIELTEQFKKGLLQKMFV